MFALMGSILSHSLMRDGKKEYYKQSVLQSKEVNLSGFLEKTLLAMTMNRFRDIVNLYKTITSVSSTTFNTAQKMKFYIKDFFSKCDQIRSFQ